MNFHTFFPRRVNENIRRHHRDIYGQFRHIAGGQRKKDALVSHSTYGRVRV